MLIHPFDHEDIVAGQGTCGLEIMEQAPDVETVLIPLGGGGLVAGAATAIKELCREQGRPDVRVVGVQAEGAAAYPTSLATGAPGRADSMNTMADGIAVARPGDVPFAAIVRLRRRRDHRLRGVAVVRLVLLLERAKMVVEPAGAAAVAAMLDRPREFEHADRRRALRRQHRPAAAWAS